ncbi:hypothetical protein D3C75_1063320 [compost metagenome]
MHNQLRLIVKQVQRFLLLLRRKHFVQPAGGDFYRRHTDAGIGGERQALLEQQIAAAARILLGGAVHRHLGQLGDTDLRMALRPGIQPGQANIINHPVARHAPDPDLLDARIQPLQIGQLRADLIVQLELVRAQRLRQDGGHQPGAEKMAHGLIGHLQRLLYPQLGLAET